MASNLSSIYMKLNRSTCLAWTNVVKDPANSVKVTATICGLAMEAVSFVVDKMLNLNL